MTKRHYISLFIVIVIAITLNFYPIEKYVMRPGNAYNVGDFITVKNGDVDDEGSFSLMTVSIAKATPATYMLAKIQKHHDILEVDAVRQQGEDENEYRVRQLKLMSDSQFNALYVAFTKADLPYTVSYKGVYVLNVLENAAADGVLQAGDVVTELDGQIISRQTELVNMLNEKTKGEEVELVIERDNELITKSVTLKEIPNSKGRIGLGITFAESKTIRTNPDVNADTEKIGGPSAGLMFTLEILNQLLEEDISKGYTIAGTGEMNEDGTVGRIGGVEKKVVAADKAGMEIFFAPDDEITEQMKENNPNIVSNYEAAAKTAKEIGTKMKIVPVKTIDDALNYLNTLQEK